MMIRLVLFRTFYFLFSFSSSWKERRASCFDRLAPHDGYDAGSAAGQSGLEIRSPPNVPAAGAAAVDREQHVMGNLVGDSHSTLPSRTRNSGAARFGEQDFAKGQGKGIPNNKWHLRLGLGNVDDGTAHAADEDHAALGVALHEVAGNGRGEEVGAVDVDGEQLAHTLDGVVGGVVVLGEAGGRDQVVDLAVLRDDVGDAGADRVRIRHVGVVGRHFWGPVLGCQLRGIHVAARSGQAELQKHPRVVGNSTPGGRPDMLRTYFLAFGLSFLNCCIRAWAWISASSSYCCTRFRQLKDDRFHRLTPAQPVILSCVRLTVHVNNGQVSARDHHALAHDQPQASRTAGDDADVTLEREGGQGWVDLEACAAGADDGLRTRELVVLGVLDGDAVIGAGELARVVGLVLVAVAGLGPGPRLLHVGASVVFDVGHEGVGGGCWPTSYGYRWPPADSSQGCACSSGEGGHGEVSSGFQMFRDGMVWSWSVLKVFDEI